MIESKGWNWNAVDGDFQNYWLTPSMESFYLLHRWKDVGFTRFLDLGCGLGRHAILFAQYGFNACALDISEEAISRTSARAKELGLRMDCKVGDMLLLPYEDESIDCILCKNVISHTDTNGVRRAVSELSRVLRRGGECYLTLSSKASKYYRQDWPQIDANTKLEMLEGPEYKVPHFYADYDLIADLFSGFEILSVYHVEDFYERAGTTHSAPHYHVLVRKKDGSETAKPDKRI